MGRLIDDIARLVASPLPRRRALRLIAGTLASAALGALRPTPARAGTTECPPGQAQCGSTCYESFCTPVCCPAGRACLNASDHVCAECGSDTDCVIITAPPSGRGGRRDAPQAGGIDPCQMRVCREGVCVTQPRDCSSLSDECNTGVCDPETGNCRRQAKENGTRCSKGGVCSNGQCVLGACAGKTCGHFQACNATTGCICVTMAEGGGFCVRSPTPCTVRLPGRRRCSADADCPDGRVCTAGKCKLRPCTTSADCPGGGFCAVKTCCSSGHSKRRPPGVCVPPSAFCGSADRPVKAPQSAPGSAESGGTLGGP